MTVVASNPAHETRQVSSSIVDIGFVALLAIVAIFRVWLATRGHSIRHPDEIFQTIEQSHRLVFGYGVVPWEFREGIRWLGTPVLLTPPMWLAKLLGLGADFYVSLTRAILALLSLLPIPFLYVLVTRRAGNNVALLACLLSLVWVEHLDFAGSTLSDAIGAPLLSTAAIGSLLCARASRTAIAILAFLIVLTFCVRFHLAPALLLIAIYALRTMPSATRLTFLLGLVISAVLFGTLDVLFGQVPYQHVYLNVYRNIFEGVAAGFGEEEWHYYFTAIWERWQWGIFVPLVAILYRWKSTWLLFGAALAVVISFSFIAHKEYRFYYPATMLFTLAAGWAIAESAFKLFAKPGRSARLGAALVSLTEMFATVLPAQSRYLDLLHEGEDPRIAAQMYVGRTSDVCGLGFDIGLVITGTAGLVHIHRGVGFDTVDTQTASADSLSRFNYLLMKVSEGSPPTGYLSARCWDELCLYRRSGGCTKSVVPDGPGP